MCGKCAVNGETIKERSYNIFPSTPRSSEWPLLCRCSNKTPVYPALALGPGCVPEKSGCK